MKTQQPEKAFHKLKDLTKYDGTLVKSIIEKAKTIYQINQELPSILKEPGNKHCWLMDFNTHQVTFGVDSAEWLIHMREQEYSLRAYLASRIGLLSFHKMKYLVKPSNFHQECTKTPQHTRSIKISTKNKELLQTMAHAITDQALKAALLRLAAD